MTDRQRLRRILSNETLDVSGKTEAEIVDTLNEYNILLTPDEIKKIQHDFLNRAPSITECVLFSIEGSEHCSYKSSRFHLQQFVTTGPCVILGAKEDAGVVSVATDNAGKRWCIVMSHESHNHPSQIVPYEGAATGVGGNVRDVCCMGAEVIATTNSLRFGDIRSNKTKWIHDGVVAGIGGYGNPLGIPNIGGDIYYHEGYNNNCLVTVVTLGVVRADEIFHSYAPENAEGYDLVLVGKPTDNSGFGGAGFASLKLEEGKKEQNKGFVQEPNAFLERHILKSTYVLFDKIKERGLLNKVGFKDLGAGGIACASVELADAAGYGADIWLDNVHIGMQDLHPSVLLCSETQERFMWVCHPDITNLIIDHYNRTFDMPGVSALACASVIGKIRKDNKYIVHFNGSEIVNAPAPIITKGFTYNRPFQSSDSVFTEPELPEPKDYNSVLLDLVAHENISSRLRVYATYDKQVQGRTIVEPGMADAGVLAPFNDEKYPEEIRHVGIAHSTDHNPLYGKIDPYWCGVNAVAEAMRNVAATGATPHAMTDCLCFGNPEKPEQMQEFVEATRGVADACKGIHLKNNSDHPVPIIAGNVSFYNESEMGAIPPSPIVSCLGRMADVNKAITSGFKKINSTILLIGERKNELGGSAYYALFSESGRNVPKPDLAEVEAEIWAMTDLIDAKLVLAAHDISDGGIAVALAEMSFENEIGCEIEINTNLRNDQWLFSQTGGFVLEIDNINLPAVVSIVSSYGSSVTALGRTTACQAIVLGSVIQISLTTVKEYWTRGLYNKLR